MGKDMEGFDSGGKDSCRVIKPRRRTNITYTFINDYLKLNNSYYDIGSQRCGNDGSGSIHCVVL